MFICDYKEDSLIDYLQYVESFTIFKYGKTNEINAENKEFVLIKNKLNLLFYSARIMPAFGVSLHTETLDVLETDNWLQINFLKELQINGLNFNALLFKMEKTNGFNLIRLYNNKYEGRCIFLDLNEEIDLKLILNSLDK